MSLVRAEGLSRSFGEVHALKEVDFTIDRGEWIAIMGPSGSGKTTLLNLLGGLDAPTSGRVLFDGREVSALSAAELAVFRRENVGFVFQQFHLVAYLTALENVMLAQYLHSMTDEKEARRVLEEVGLGDRLDHLPAELSGGEQQRVCVARALINQPKLVLADEPTGNLDEANAERLIEIFADLHRRGHTLVMVTHDPDLGKLADRRFELHHGTLTGWSRSSKEEEELIDDVLQQLWESVEAGAGANECADGPSLLGNRKLMAILRTRGLVSDGDGESTLTASGQERARTVIRRHRLAERLFQDTFDLRGNDQIEANACVLEHVLSPELTESICRFLGHPSTCPHRRPIPKGSCCA